MPTPKAGESKDDFIKRCIPIVIDDGTAKDGKQAYAICASMFSQKEIVTHTGAMVALPVPEAFQLVQGLSFPPDADVLPPDEMHVTLSFLGDVSTGNVDANKLFSICEKFAAGQSPIVGRINGYGIFTETHLDNMECLWLSLDAPVLPEFRQALLKVLDKNGFPDRIQSRIYSPYYHCLFSERLHSIKSGFSSGSGYDSFVKSGMG